MSDGLWDTGNPDRLDIIQQPLFNRMRILRVNTDTPGALDASGFAAQDPTTAPLDVNVNGGPHFIMSPETQDRRPTLGFEFGLIVPGGGGSAIATAPGFDVTIWRLVEATMQQTIAKNWLAFATLTSVNYNQLYSSFDVNTSALRFQVNNVDTDGSLILCFAEL